MSMRRGDLPRRGICNHTRGCDTVYIEAYVTIDLGVMYA